MKRLICLLFVAMMLLTSCNRPGDNGDNTDKGSTVIDIVKDSVSQYKIVRAENASNAISTDSKNFRKNLSEKTFSELEIGTDITIRGEEVDNSQFEILIGETNRDASKAFYASLAENSYGYRVTDNKIVIGGTDDSLTALALYAFENEYVYNTETCGAGFLKVNKDDEKLYLNSDGSSMRSIMRSSHPISVVMTNCKKQPTIGDYKATQGSATDGTYVYIILKWYISEGNEVDKIVKKRMDNWTTVAVSEQLPLDHANEMCYDTKRNRLVVANMKDDKITIIDPETLTVKEVVHNPNEFASPYAIAYCPETDKYVMTYNGRFHVTDENFKEESSAIVVNSTGHMAQGMDCDQWYIYMPRSGYTNPETGVTAKNNVVAVYAWNGALLKNIEIPTTMESESMMNIGGKYYINFNSSGSQIYEISYVILYK